MAAVDVLYNVGARDESRSLTGIAHLFEHLMFGGSLNVPDFDGELEDAGGQSNAWTSNDFTNFYETLPAQNLDTALHLESDRMLSPAFSEQSLQVQRDVVIEEFKQTCLDRPYGHIWHDLRALLYSQDHPYSWPTLGLTPEHVAGITLDDARRWFFSHYAPNNAVLAIAGNVTFDRACRAAEEWFADVPPREITPRQEIDPGFPREDVYAEQRSNVPVPLLITAYPMAAYGEEGYFAADTLTDILSAGRASRLVNNVTNGSGKGLIAGADASIIGSEGPGMLLLTATLASNKDEDIARAHTLLRDEALRLTEPGNISFHELERTLNNFEATFRFEGMDKEEAGFRRAMAVMHGENPEACVAAKFAQTPAEIAEAAASMASGPMATLVYRPR